MPAKSPVVQLGSSVRSKRAIYSDRAQQPSVLTVNFDTIPAKMRAERRWVLFRLIWKPDKKGGGKWDKVPYRPDGGRASSTNSKTWATFAEVKAAYESGGFDGIGFVLGIGWAGIDLDDVYDHRTGEVRDPILDRLATESRTYCDVSPSGTGVKLFGHGVWMFDWHKRPLPGGGEIEVYGGGRYFCVTGHRYGDSTDVVDMTHTLENMAAEFADEKKADVKVEPKRRAEHRAELGDDELLVKIRRSKQGGKFAALYDRGDTSGHGRDQSRADLALCYILAFWTQKDAARIDRLFRGSALYRAKWDEKRGVQTYGSMTIAEAIARTAEEFEPTPVSSPKIKLNGTPSAPTGAAVSDPPVTPTGANANPNSGVAIILDHYRQRYCPDYRQGNLVHSRDGTMVTMAVATAVPDSQLIDRLADATDAPRFPGGVVKRASLPKFFSTWAKVAWGDLLRELPDEDQAELSDDSTAAETFRRIVRDAMLSEVVLGDIIGKHDVTRTERRSVIDWCAKFAKLGPWRSIRSKKVWCKTRLVEGEIRLLVALRVELFAQLRADKRLCEISQNTFARRAARYGVGKSTRKERPEGLSAVVLTDTFMAELTEGIVNEPESEDERDERFEREAIDTLGGG